MKTIYFLFFMFCFLFLGCKGKEKVVREEPPPAKPIPVEVSPPQYETYQYLDMGRRDPFVPLIGPGGIAEGMGKQEVEVVVEEGTKAEEKEMEGWAISGFVWDKGERMAIIKNNEESYIFAFGKLSDKNGEPIPGIKAKTKDDGILLVKDKKEIFLKMEEKYPKEEEGIE